MGDDKSKKDLTNLIDLADAAESSPSSVPDFQDPFNLTGPEIPGEFDNPIQLGSPTAEEFDPSAAPSIADNLGTDFQVQDTSPEAAQSEVFFDPISAQAPNNLSLTSIPDFCEYPQKSDAPDAIQEVRKFAENAGPKGVAVEAAFPFSLLIEGKLTDAEKEKLLDLLSREKMGFREVDLEPQFANHRVLIPRISEYAGILLVQALRSANVRMRLGPSEQIFEGPEAHSANGPEESSGDETATYSSTSPSRPDPNHPAEKVPITSDASMPELPHFSVIDAVTVSATLRTKEVAVERSREFQEIVDSLQRELKYRAYHRGANAIFNYEIRLTALPLTAGDYKILMTGTAVRGKSPVTRPAGQA